MSKWAGPRHSCPLTDKRSMLRPSMSWRVKHTPDRAAKTPWRSAVKELHQHLRTEYIKTKHVLTVETYPRLRYQHPSTDSRRGIILTLNIVQNVLTGQTCSRPTYQHTLTASRRGTIPTVKTDYIRTTNVLTGQTYSRPHHQHKKRSALSQHMSWRVKHTLDR